MLQCLDKCLHCILPSVQSPRSAMVRGLVDQRMFCEGDAALQVLGEKGQDLESFYMYPSIITVMTLPFFCMHNTHPAIPDLP